MAIVKSFCFWFSVRLGSIIIACITLIQAIAWLILSATWIEQSNEDSAELTEFLAEFSINYEALKEFVDAYLTSFTAFCTGLIASCVFLVIGAVKCNPFMIYPFILAYLIYVGIIGLGHVMLMLNLKNEDVGIGLIILYSNMGGFLILYLLYLWACVFSFVQIIHDLRKEIKRKSYIKGVAPNKNVNIVKKIKY